MKLSEFELREDNHFIAMQYYALILNRTYLVLIVDNHLIGIVSNGLVSVKGGGDPLTYSITSKMSVDGDLNNPLSYLNESYLQRIKDMDLLGNNIINVNKANFKIKLNEITTVTHNPKKKWGMGYYPHDGKLYIEVNEKTKEFILLGNQSGQRISTLLQKIIFNNNVS